METSLENLFVDIGTQRVKSLTVILLQKVMVSPGTSSYGVHLRTKIIENKRQFEVQKLDYPCRNLVI